MNTEPTTLSYATPIERPSLTWKARAALAASAFALTAVYAISFHWAEVGPSAVVAARIGIAAGASWVVIGAAAVAWERARLRALWSWADTCLFAMFYGNAALLAAVALNAVVAATRVDIGYGFAFVFMLVHALILVIADVVIGSALVSGARRYGSSDGAAIVGWLVLNLTFALVLWALFTWDLP